MVTEFQREWPAAKPAGRTIRIVPRRRPTPYEVKLRRLIAECFDVEETEIVTEVDAAMTGVDWSRRSTPARSDRTDPTPIDTASNVHPNETSIDG
jgi:hypothetical protein